MHKAFSVMLALAWAFGPPAALAQDSDLALLRAEMRELRKDYVERLQALEQRLAEAERSAAKAEEAAAPAAKAADVSPAVPPSARATAAFNPAISLILQGTYARTSRDPEGFVIGGFVPSGGEVGPPRRSFGLGESELFFTASIDPYFRGALVAALTPDKEVDVEEAYFQTLALPRGFTAKGGRFLSGIGYQNEIHQHAWDFQDAPLPYQAFLGGRFLQDGAQLRWIAPTATFLELGAEFGNGGAFPSSDRNKNGFTTAALLARVGGDIGQSYAWGAGLSYLRTSAADRAYEDLDSLGNAVRNSFAGRSRLWVADAVLKWAPGGNPTQTSFKLQAEYFRAREDGTLVYDDAGAVFGTRTGSFRTRQSGWYAQGIYQFMPRWRVGYRYDRLRSGMPAIGIVADGLGPTVADFPKLARHDPSRNTAMIDFSPSEFSRLRLQYAIDKSSPAATDRQLILQYIHSLGAHGGHPF